MSSPPEPSGPPPRPAWPAVLAIAVIVIGLYARTLAYPFVWDDHLLVETNRAVTGPGRLGDAFRKPLPLRETKELYRPVVVLSYRLNHAISGLHPWGYHLTNLLLHLAKQPTRPVAGRPWARAPDRPGGRRPVRPAPRGL